MEAPAKRNAFLDWLFGAPLTGEELAVHLSARPPRLARNGQMALCLFAIVMGTLGLFGLADRLPGVGWLLRDWSTPVGLGCVAASSAISWFYKQRANRTSARL